LQKALSSASPCARMWIHANLNWNHNLLEEDNARDEYMQLAGFSPILDKCGWCGKTAINIPSEDHAVSCTSRYLNKSVGHTIQDAVKEAVALFEHVDQKEPVLRDHALVKIWDDDDRECRADIRTLHGGTVKLLDVSFTATFQVTAKQRLAGGFIDAERPSVEKRAHEKRLDARKKMESFPEDIFVPCVVDSKGMWGKDLYTYLLEAREDLKQKRKTKGKWEDNDQSQERQSLEWKNAKELISLAVCRANGEYMRVARTGRVRSGENRQEVQERLRLGKEERERRRQVELETTMTELAPLFEESDEEPEVGFF
jgi:hypothetical protein